jgi:hypothetical protein
MAVPTIRSTSSGVVTSRSSVHSITMPGTVVAGDMLLCYISIAPSAWAMRIAASSSTNWYTEFAYYPIDYFEPCLTVLTTNATLGGGNDYLTIGTYYPFWHNGSMDADRLCESWLGLSWFTYHARNCKIAYVCYAISGAHVYVNADPYKMYIDSYTAGSFTSNWNFSQCPPVDDSSIQDYLWILTSGSQKDEVATVAPSGFSGLITKVGSTSGYNNCSISSCSRTSTTLSIIDPGAFTAPTSYWAGQLRRIAPLGSDSTPPVPPSTSIGVGTYIYKEEFSEIPPAYILVDPTDQNYNSDGTFDTDNPYGYYVEVISSAAWTATWNTGTRFTAGVLSGPEGVTYVSINCVGSNTSGLSYTDTLVFTISGSMDSVNCEQVSS